jgi:cation:H+ antiporter
MVYVGLLFTLGLIIIIKGGDMFVDSAVWFAKVTGIPNILIGATIVSLATTLPELFVSTIATFQGAPEVAIGNAVGSTICNLGLILALSMIFMPGKIEKYVLKSKGGLMIVSTFVAIILSLDRLVNFYDGLILLALLALYVYMNIIEVKNSKAVVLDEAAAEFAVNKDRNSVIINGLQFAAGAVLIVLGARLLVSNGISLAEFFGIPQSIISLTLIALGTSLPELVTTITAIVKKHHDISVGNIIGANILNTTMILGTSAVTAARGLIITERTINVFDNAYTIPHTLYVDIPVSLLLMFLVVIPSLFSGKLKRWQGGTAILIYAAYIVFLGASL